MTVIEHLSEFRDRIVRAFAAFVVGSIVAYLFYVPLLHLLTRPLAAGGRIGHVQIDNLYVAGIVTGFLIRLKISIFFGLVFALPVILWQLWRFIVPGLEPRERKFGIAFVGASVGLFALGAFCAFVILPPSIGFLLHFTAPFKPLIHVDQYLSFVSFMVLAFGISFEFPLLLVFLAGIGILSSAKLRSWRRPAIFLAAVVGAVATPSQDPYSMLLMSIPLYILYEVSIVFIRYAMRK